jgi:hypothetical protein
MWIINKYGVAINTDCVARFRTDGQLVVADMIGLPSASAATVVGETTVEDIMNHIHLGIKFMEVL